MQYPIIDLIKSAYINNGWTGLDISSPGKNLYNESLYPMTRFYYINGNVGTTEESATRCATFDYINIINLIGQTITLNHGPGGFDPGFAFYDENKKYISGFANKKILADGAPWTITIPNDNNIVYMRFSSLIENIGQIQIELGSQSTPYEPYSEPKNDFPNRLKLPLPHYFPHPVIDALQRAAAGTQTADDTEILRHYLTPLGIGGI